MILHSKAIIALFVGGAVVSASIGTAVFMAATKGERPIPVENNVEIVTPEQQQAISAPELSSGRSMGQEARGIDCKYAGDFCLLRDDFVRDSARTIRAVGQDMELITSEGHRVNLVLPPNNTLPQDVTMSPLAVNPFPPEIAQRMKGTGIWVSPRYSGLSGRPFAEPAWLVFDFSPDPRTFSKRVLRDFCRPDFAEFDPVRCLNKTNGTLAHDSLFAFYIDTEGRMLAKLTPIIKLGEEVYAVAVLEEGVYVPFTLVGAEGVQLASNFIEMTASSTLKEPSRFIEAARALQHFQLMPEEHMAAKIKGFPGFLETNLFWQMLVAEFSDRLGVLAGADQKIIDQLTRRMSFTRFSARDWPEYASSAALVRRSYPDSKYVPDILAEDVGKVLLDKFKRRSTSIKDKVAIVDAVFEILQFKKWHDTVEDKKVSLFDRVIPFARAHEIVWTDEIEAEIRKQMCALVDETSDTESLLVLAGMSLTDFYEAPECYEKAMGKIKDGIAAGIANTPAPGPNDPPCEVLIKKNLSNYGMNQCTGSMGTLLDLASQAMRIEEDGLANAALGKAGLLK